VAGGRVQRCPETRYWGFLRLATTTLTVASADSNGAIFRSGPGPSLSLRLAQPTAGRATIAPGTTNRAEVD